MALVTDSDLSAQLDDLVARRGHTLGSFAREAGVSDDTLGRFKKDEGVSITSLLRIRETMDRLPELENVVVVEREVAAS